MKIRSNKFMVSAMAAGMLAAMPFAQSNAATAVTTIELQFPQILILYTYDFIYLDVDPQGLVDSLTSGLGQECTDQYCVNSPFYFDRLDIFGGVATVDADIQSQDLGISSDVFVEIRNAFGVRGLGFSNYTASVAPVGGSNPGLFTNEGVSQPNYSGLSFETGDLFFTLDLNNVSDFGFESQSYAITVTGN